MSRYKNIALAFSLPKEIFFHFFGLSLYKIVDVEYSTGKSSQTSIGTLIKNPEMLGFVSDYLKT